MKRHSIVFIITLLLTGCTRHGPGLFTALYSDYIQNSPSIYGIDKTLVKAIIQVESSYNPSVVSKSNAIGLMQLKTSTTGRDVFRLKGRHGQPSTHKLKNAATNVNLGTAH